MRREHLLREYSFDAKIKSILNNLENTVKFKEVDFPKGTLHKWREVYHIADEIQKIFLSLDTLLTRYAYLCKLDHKEKVPGAGLLNKQLNKLSHELRNILDDLTRIPAQAAKQVNENPDTDAILQGYQLVSKRAKEAEAVIKDLLEKLSTELKSNKQQNYNSYKTVIEKLVKILSALPKALNQLSDTIDHELLQG